MDIMPEPIFVVAAPCAGTGLLMKLLRTAEGVRTLDASQRVAAMQAVEKEGDAAGPPLPGSEQAPGDSVETRLRALYTGSQRVVSAASHHALSIPLLRATFPNARFIYLYRKAADHMAQAIHGTLTGKVQPLSELRGWAARAREAEGEDNLQNLSLEDIVALRWKFYTGTILDDLALLPKEARCAVSYEDLIGDPMRVCGQLGVFAGLRFSHSPLVMAGYRQHLRRQADVQPCTPASWTTPLVEQAEAFALEAHPGAALGEGASFDAAMEKAGHAQTPARTRGDQALEAAPRQTRKLPSEQRNQARRGSFFSRRWGNGASVGSDAETGADEATTVRPHARRGMTAHPG